MLLSWSLAQDELNKFFWWPLHLSGWLLSLGFVPLLVGLRMLRQTNITITLGPAWIPLTAAGVVVLISTFAARGRLDTYGRI